MPRPSPSRRQFIAAAAAGVAAADRIDCQNHLYDPAMLDLLEKRTSDPLVYWTGRTAPGT